MSRLPGGAVRPHTALAGRGAGPGPPSDSGAAGWGGQEDLALAGERWPGPSARPRPLGLAFEGGRKAGGGRRPVSTFQGET